MKRISPRLARAKARGIRIVETTGTPVTSIKRRAVVRRDAFDLSHPPRLDDPKRPADATIQTERERWIFWRGYARALADFGYVRGARTP
jgi:hypothetical protein